MDATANLPEQQRQTNWGMIVRVGVVVALILGLVGYALKVTYESVVKGGIVNAGDHYDVELKAMSNFEMDQSRGTLADVPEMYRKLDGKRVVLVGEVAPLGDTAGSKTTRFSLCYSVARCCFGGPPKVHHLVDCQVPGGRQVTNYVGGPPVKVYGTLKVNVIHDGDAIKSVYQMDVERVDPLS